MMVSPSAIPSSQLSVFFRDFDVSRESCIMLKMLLKSRCVLYIVLMLLILLALTPSLLFLNVQDNTLENNGCWVVTKRTFDVELIGATSYYFDTQALAHSRLNL